VAKIRRSILKEVQKSKLGFYPETTVFILKTSRYHLYISAFTVFMDHKSLKCLFDQNELNIRQRRWMDTFKDYEFILQYHHWRANATRYYVIQQRILVSSLIWFINKNSRKVSLYAIGYGIFIRRNTFRMIIISISNGLIENIHK